MMNHQSGLNAPEPLKYKVELLNEREKTHGSFDANAAVSQSIKEIMEASAYWKDLAYQQRESLHLIASKIGRILAGGANVVDTWRDIAGYAQLIEHRLAPPP